MKTLQKIKPLLIIVFLLPFSMQSCFDLEEETFSILDASVYYKDEASIEGIIARLYTSNDGNEEPFTELQELPADQINWRTWNGGAWGWDDGARYFISTQNWNPQTTRISYAWQEGFNTIGLCNSALEDFSSLVPEKLNTTKERIGSYIAEVRTLRAWVYYRMFELYGGVLPLCTTIDPSILPPSAATDFDEGCKIIYDFISGELDDTVDDLPKNLSNRMNQAVNRILKARLLLNAELFIGEDYYSECEALSQCILNGDFGTYSLAQNYQGIFAYNNDQCNEIIFATSWEEGYYQNAIYRVVPYLPSNLVQNYFGDGPALNVVGCWNAWIVNPSYDNSGNILLGEKPQSFLLDYGDKLGAVLDRMNNTDVRKQNFVYSNHSNQFKGIFLQGEMKANYGTGEPILADADRDGQNLVYVDQVGTFQNIGRGLETVMSPRWGETNSGVRLIKYPIYPASSGIYYTSADNVYFRFAEVYYMLAECKLRKGDTNEAKNLVNQVRKRYFSSENWAIAENEFPGFNTIDLDWMLSQWGLEFIAEGQRRRTDLRRFDKFTQGQWWFFGRAVGDDGNLIPAQRDRKYEWYPIPSVALSANPNLSQNPDYL